MIKLKKNDLRNITLVLIGAAVVLFAFSYYLKLRDNSRNPSKLFWAAVDNALASEHVTHGNTITGDNGEKIRQLINIDYSNIPIAQNLVIVTGGGAEDITTMTIGTADADYLRYMKTSNDDIRAKWAQLPLEQTANGRFLVEAITQTLVLSGNMNDSSRAEFIKMLKDTGVYKVQNTREVTKDSFVKLTVVTVQIDIGAFTSAQKELLKRLGLTYAAENLSGTDQTGTTTAEFAIMTNTKQFFSAGIPNIDTASAEGFGWSAEANIHIPQPEISYDELQKALTGGENASGN